jgi:hypothetical protein
MWLTMLSRALSGLPMPIMAATVEGVNLVDGAAAARDRSTRHALRGTFGYPLDAMRASARELQR